MDYTWVQALVNEVSVGPLTSGTVFWLLSLRFVTRRHAWEILPFVGAIVAAGNGYNYTVRLDDRRSIAIHPASCDRTKGDTPSERRIPRAAVDRM